MICDGVASFLAFGVNGWSCSNLLASTLIVPNADTQSPHDVGYLDPQAYVLGNRISILGDCSSFYPK